MEPLNDSSSSLFPLETCPPVNDEAFNLFHTIDRELYTRLTHNLRRDPAESMHVMAFWMWLEKQGAERNLIRRLLSLPPVLVNELAEEAIACLKCVENDAYPFGDNNNDTNEISLLPDLLSNNVVSLRFFHENRIAVLRGVSKILTTVCIRAFNDIMQRLWTQPAPPPPPTGVGVGIGPGMQFLSSPEIGESSRMGEIRNGEGGVHVINVPPQGQGQGQGQGGMPVLYHQAYYNVPFVPLHPGLIRVPLPPQQPPLMVPDHHHHAIGIHPFHNGVFHVYDLAAQRQMLGEELGELLNQNLTLTEQDTTTNNEEEILPADDRTIFLTFSKGYPITEDEVREFFTRRFGDFIEDLIMQEVEGDEQVLYARMVASSASVIDGIVRGNRTKYSINGKHVWARKYVKKQNPSRSPPRDGDSDPSSSGAQP